MMDLVTEIIILTGVCICSCYGVAAFLDFYVLTPIASKFLGIFIFLLFVSYIHIQKLLKKGRKNQAIFFLTLIILITVFTVYITLPIHQMTDKVIIPENL